MASCVSVATKQGYFSHFASLISLNSSCENGFISKIPAGTKNNKWSSCSINSLRSIASRMFMALSHIQSKTLSYIRLNDSTETTIDSLKANIYSLG